MELPSSLVIPPGIAADRADKTISDLFSGDVSRSAVARLMRDGRILVNTRPVRPSTMLKPGDRVEILPSAPRADATTDPELPAVPIVFEDNDVIVVDKPPGLVVHPGAGRSAGTLMDVLVATRPEMIGVGEPDRWGIVHRLDRDTSGVMVVAKTARAYVALSAQFKEHSVHRIYIALVRGNPSEEDGIIDAELGRHSKDRKRISTVTRKGRRAITRWRVLERLSGMALLEITPETGRTHQIRVHLASRGFPVVGDAVYGKARKKGVIVAPEMRRIREFLHRQALHAGVLGFAHPADSRYVEFSSPLPHDMVHALAICRNRAGGCCPVDHSEPRATRET
jgi:23S rRNA pseudouridine1911/1915/1917 synthase